MKNSFAESFVKTANASDGNAGAAPVKSMIEQMSELYGSEVATKIVQNVMAPALKNIGTVDIVPLRVVDLPDAIAMQYNAEARFWTGWSKNQSDKLLIIN